MQIRNEESKKKLDVTLRRQKLTRSRYVGKYLFNNSSTYAFICIHLILPVHCFRSRDLKINQKENLISGI